LRASVATKTLEGRVCAVAEIRGRVKIKAVNIIISFFII
jgi:hypothetical protein